MFSRQLFRTIATLVVLVLLGAGLAACGSEPAAQAPTPLTAATQELPEAPTVQSGFPVSIESCGQTFTYQGPPERAVVFDANMIEIMLALGLDQRIAGYWDAGGKLRPQFQQRAADLRSLSSESWPPPSLETVLNVQPDFVFAAWGYFSEESGLTPDALLQMGINSYALRESCTAAGRPVPSTIDNTYADIAAIGRIFGAEREAGEQIASLRAELDAVAERLGTPERPLRAFVYDDIGGDSPYTAGKYGLITSLLASAGAQNLFTDLDADWAKVSWEEVLGRDPEVIVVVDTDWEPATERIERLKTLPLLADLPAVKAQRFVVIHYRQIYPGLQNAEAVRLLAEKLYPERFQ